MRKKLIIPLLSLITLVVCAFFVLKFYDKEDVYYIKEDTKPDFNLMSMDGEEVVLSKQKSSFILVNFWETRCDFCLDQIEDFVKLDRIFSSSELSIVGICVHSRSYNINRVISVYGITYPVVIGKVDTRWDFGDFTEGVPLTYLLDSDRNIIKKYIGYVPGAGIRQDIDVMLRSR